MTPGVRSGPLVAAGVAAIGVTYGFGRYSYGLFVPDIRADYGLRTELLGVVASGSYGGYMLAIAASALLAERLGARRLVVAGMLATTGGMALVAAGGGAAPVAIGVVVAGSGSGLVWPALSDALQRGVPAETRGRAFALVNSGTSYAVALAGPVALLAGHRWRLAWVVFVVLALAVTAWCAVVVPARTAGVDTPPLPGRAWLARDGAGSLLGFALAYGATTAVYWTFAADLVADRRGGGRTAPLTLMTLVGVAGIAGGAAGFLARRLGLARTLVGGTCVTALATVLLPVAGEEWAGIVPSGLLFGATFILVAGAALLWTVEIFGDRPAVGVGALTFAFTIGSVVGPASLGAVAGAFGLPVAFGVSAAGLVGSSLIALRAPRAKMAR